MLDRIIFGICGAIDNFFEKLDIISHEGYKKIRSFFKGKRKRK